VAEEKALISEFKTAQREAGKTRETRDKENKDPFLVKGLYVQLQEKKQVCKRERDRARERERERERERGQQNPLSCSSRAASEGETGERETERQGDRGTERGQ